MRKAVITGAGGFVGRWLVNRLIEYGVHVTAVDLEDAPGLSLLPKSDLMQLVLCRSNDAENLHEIIQNQNFDVFYNLAWVGAAGPKRADYNIQLNNIKMCLDYYVSAYKMKCTKFVSVGTIGQFLAELSVKNNIISQNFTYALAKSFCEQLLRFQEKKYGCEIVWATFSNLYGPGDTTSNLVNYTIKTLLSGQSPTFGPALQPYDFIHVSDSVEALYHLGFTKTKTKSFLVGSGKPRILKEFLMEIQSIVAPDIEVGIGVRPDDNTVYKMEWFDTTALIEETEFIPKYSFSSGILETTEWIKMEQRKEN